MTSGNLFIISAPSGAGKTSLVHGVIDSMRNIAVSVSHTTRPKRPNERPNLDYYFVSDAIFNAMIKNKDFLEHAVVFGHQYGTSKIAIQEKLKQGIDIILEIDWQGAKQVRQRCKEAIGIFILPPSLDTLRERLLHRNQDLLSTIEGRLKKAAEEVHHCHEYDYLVINDHFDHALIEIQSIIRAERCRYTKQQATLAPLLKHFPV
jgi:guanylate kinase